MVARFQRLKVSHKLTLISVLFMIPDSVLLCLFLLSINSNIRFAEWERYGNAYQRPLEDLLEYLPDHLMLFVRSDLDRAQSTTAGTDLRARIDRTFEALEDVDEQFGTRLQFTDEGLAKRAREHCRVRNLKSEWLELKRNLGTLSHAARTQQHLHLMADLRTMITHVGDNSNLILDPDLDSYYLMDVTLLALPEIQSRLSTLMVYGAGVLQRTTIGNADSRQLAVYAALLKQSDLDRIVASAKTALNEDANFYGVSESLQRHLPPSLEMFVAETEKFIQLTTRLSETGHPDVSADDFLAAGARARAASFALWRVADEELDLLLAERIHYYRDRRAKSFILTALALGAAVLLVAFITRSISRPLQAQAVQLMQSNQALHAAEQKYRGIFENAVEGIFQSSPEGQYLTANPTLARMYGYASVEEMQCELTDLGNRLYVDSTRRLEFQTEMDQSDQVYRFESQVRRKDGSVIWVSEHARAVRDAAGVLRYYEGTVEDVTERKRAEERLTASLREVNDLKAALDEHALVAITDPQGKIVCVNDKFCAISRYSREELLGQDHRIINSGHHTKEFIRNLWATISRGVVWHGEIKNKAKNGSFYWVDTTIVPFFNEDGKPRQYVAIRADITARKRSEDALEKAHKELLETSRQAGMAEVATGVLHNVGNVLNSVNVSAILVGDKLKKSRATHLAKVVTMLREHAHDLGAFITTDTKGRQIPDFLATLTEQMESERTRLLVEIGELQKNVCHIKDIVAMQQTYAKVSGMTEIVNLKDLVEDALRMNGSALDRHRVQAIREFEEVPPITVDKHKVLQILINLIRNAKCACDEVGLADRRLTVRIGKSEDRVRIEVADNGVGIPAENLTRIFNHGFTTRKDGHGFGLHSGALAAREMGGSLNVHSDGSGRGATFTIELPLEPPRKLDA